MTTRFVTDDTLDNWVQYHPPIGEGVIGAHHAVRRGAREFMAAVQEAVPECPDKTVALRAIRDAMMQANAAIACNQPATVV